MLERASNHSALSVELGRLYCNVTWRRCNHNLVLENTLTFYNLLSIGGHGHEGPCLGVGLMQSY